MAKATKRLYHFTATKWALIAIRDRRLKAADPDDTNDLFEYFARQWETVENRAQSEWFRWRGAQGDPMSARLLCLSATCENPLLWGHYADKGKGIALGFDASGALPIFYTPNRVPPDGQMFEEVRQIFGERGVIAGGWDEHKFVKAKYWEHEQEWRMYAQVYSLYLCPMSGLHYFPFEGRMTLREILIGPRHENYNIRYQLEKVISDYDPKPEIFSTRLSSSEFRIERE